MKKIAADRNYQILKKAVSTEDIRRIDKDLASIQRRLPGIKIGDEILQGQITEVKEDLRTLNSRVSKLHSILLKIQYKIGMD